MEVARPPRSAQAAAAPWAWHAAGAGRAIEPPARRARAGAPPDEIAATLDATGHNRRLSFDREMLPYCGRTVRVKDRVERIIEDKTGRMLKIPKDCLILDGAVARASAAPATGTARARSTRTGARRGYSASTNPSRV